MMLPLFRAVMKIIFCKTVQELSQFCCHLFYQHKMGSFDHGFLSVEKGRSQREQDQVNEGGEQAQ